MSDLAYAEPSVEGTPHVRLVEIRLHKQSHIHTALNRKLDSVQRPAFLPPLEQASAVIDEPRDDMRHVYSVVNKGGRSV